MCFHRYSYNKNNFTITNERQYNITYNEIIILLQENTNFQILSSYTENYAHATKNISSLFLYLLNICLYFKYTLFFHHYSCFFFFISTLFYILESAFIALSANC